MKALSVGVVGLGLGRHHAAGYDRSEAVGRIAVCDGDGERVAEVRGRLKKATAGYADLGAMLSSERLDAVSVVTPDHLHRPHAEACLSAGCHVLLTKPLATNLADGRAIVAAADASGRKLMVAHERRFRSNFSAVKRLLEAGRLGRIIHLRIDAVQDKRDQFARSPWYASAEAGRTALVGTGIHEVDLMRWFVGEPIESVFAFSNRLGGLRFPADKTTAAVYRFAGGAIGQVTVTYEAHWPAGGAIDEGFRMVCTQGMVVGGRYALDGGDGWQQLPVDEQPTIAGTFGCVDDFLAAILDDRPVAVDAREGFRSLAAAAAADESAATGRPTVPAGA